MDELKEVKEKTRIRQPMTVDLGGRPVVAVSLGPHIGDRWLSYGAACVHPDPRDPETMIAGTIKRFAYRPPTADEKLMKELGRFTEKWLKKNLTPLSPGTDVSFETWLKNTNYEEWRKVELRKAHHDGPDLWTVPARAARRKYPKYFHCKSFMKDEFYQTWKHARGINSRHDKFKCLVGPIFHAIEEEVYKHPAFIKHVPVADRPDYIMKMLYRVGASYVATDYTSFESLFTRLIMQTVEFKLYDYMTKNLSVGPRFMEYVNEILGGRNKCKFKTFTVDLEATRMSGEMCTSLGNGFSNLMFMLFMCEKLGCKDVAGVVEGDDGLFTMVGAPPTKDDFAQLGLVIKMEHHQAIETASFCGLLFDPEDRLIVTDPRKVLGTFGWTKMQYLKAKDDKLDQLLRAKSLSLAYQYPGCPIISALGQYGLRITREQDLGWVRKVTTNPWERERLDQCLKRGPVKPIPPPHRTRQLVAKLYNIPVDVQVEIEKYLDGLSVKQPLDHPLINLLVPQPWFKYFSDYTQLHTRDMSSEKRLHKNRVGRREWDYVNHWVVQCCSRT